MQMLQSNVSVLDDEAILVTVGEDEAAEARVRERALADTYLGRKAPAQIDHLRRHLHRSRLLDLHARVEVENLTATVGVRARAQHAGRRVSATAPEGVGAKPAHEWD
jgi:hypothetical protein